MRIIQITDLHINASNEPVKGEADTRANLFLLLQQIINADYDLLTITGDFCLDKPQREIYDWIKSQLETSLDYSKIHVIPGNHDDSQILHHVLCPEKVLTDNELFYTIQEDNQELIFLDTGKGESSGKQKDWLKKQISRISGRNVYVFMHHPPLICGVTYMDQQHALKDMDDYQAIFSSFPERQFHCFCGHYHVDRMVISKNVNVYITPSSYVQIDPNAPTFVPDHYDIGYRNIEITEDKLITEVRYIL